MIVVETLLDVKIQAAWGMGVAEEIVWGSGGASNPTVFYFPRLICKKVGGCQEEMLENLVLGWDEDMEKIGP